MNKNIKKIAAVLTAGLILTGCNKNTAINANKSEAESPIDTKEIIQAAEWNNEVIDKTIGENEEKIIIKAKVNILSDDIYEGSIKKEFPTVEMIENELCDGKKMEDVSDVYNSDLEDGDEAGKFYEIYYKESDILDRTYSYDDNAGEYGLFEYDSFHFYNWDSPASFTDAKRDDELILCEDTLAALNMNVKAKDSYDGKKRNCTYKIVNFYNTLENIPVVRKETGMELTTVKMVDSQIVNIRFAPEYEFVSDKKKVDKIINPESLMEIVEKDLCDGKLTGYPDDVIDKITLCYMENEENYVIPVWAFSIYWGDMDNVVYVYDAVNGNLIIN